MTQEETIAHMHFHDTWPAHAIGFTMQEYARLTAAEKQDERSGKPDSSPNKPTKLFETPDVLMDDAEGRAGINENDSIKSSGNEIINESMERDILRIKRKRLRRNLEVLIRQLVQMNQNRKRQLQVNTTKHAATNCSNKLQQPEAKPARRSKRVALRERLLAREDDGKASQSEESGMR